MPLIFEMDSGEQEFVQNALGTENMRNSKEENSQTWMPFKENRVSQLDKKIHWETLKIVIGKKLRYIVPSHLLLFLLNFIDATIPSKDRVNILYRSNSTNSLLQILVSN